MLDFDNRQICFSKPRRLTDIEPWHMHIPFIFYLIQHFKPKLIVELGVHKGDSYCAICQAVDELGLESLCYGIDTWSGDEHAGYYSDDIYNELYAYHEPLYSGFSKLMKMTFDDACVNFSDGSIDLLHIDGAHRYEDVLHDFTIWLQKMSERSVILFHDISVRHSSFGVWKLWEELKDRYPSLELPHRYGIGIIYTGNVLSRNSIPPLFTLEPISKQNLSDFFCSLGQSVLLCSREKKILLLSQEFQSTTEQLQSTTEQLQSTTEQLQSTTEQLNTTNIQLHAIKQTIGWRVLRRIYSFIDFILPPSKRRRKIYRLIRKSFLKITISIKDTFRFLVSFRRTFLARSIPTPSIEEIFVGGGDFKVMGCEFLDYFVNFGSLHPSDSVLDVGCGIGRMARPLVTYLNHRGKYNGFDIVKAGIDWCEKNIHSRFPNFNFQHVNIYNAAYNPQGKIMAKDFIFPYRSDEFDFVILTSVFTHMVKDDVMQYAKEIYRTLKVGGRCFVTFFLINNESLFLIQSGKARLDYFSLYDFCADLKMGIDEAIAYDERLILDIFESIGFTLREKKYGSWCGRSEYMSYQDILIFEKYLSEDQKISSEGEENNTCDSKAVNRLDLSIDILRKKIAPLSLSKDENQKIRVNILISTIDFNYFFAGYITVFNFAENLFSRGRNVRLIITDETCYNLVNWKKKISDYGCSSDFFDKIEIQYVFDRRNIVNVNPRDCFIATAFYLAHIAHDALRFLDSSKRFIYFIQEYETLFFASGAIFALCEESYSFYHNAIFSSELLRDYFRRKGLGVYGESILFGDDHSISFENAIVNAPEPRKRTKKIKKLLYYARPELHALRNAFELGCLALSRAIDEGIFDDSWEFYGIGSITDAYTHVNLSGQIKMTIIKKKSLSEYKNILRNCDIGFALIMSPHPGLVPIEMAAAGLIVVTNTFENKTIEELRSICKRIIGAQPTIQGISNALGEAVRIYNAGEIGAETVNWAKSWDESFNEKFMIQVSRFIDE